MSLKNNRIITFKNVSKMFQTKNYQTICAFNNLSFDVYENEIVSFVGPSGCGKTTVLRIISGLEKQSGGEVNIDGNPVKIGTCGMVFQSYSSFPWLTVLDNVAFGLKIQKMSKHKRYSIARNYIELVGLSEYENHFPRQLSGGQKQRVAIARSLAVENRILLMDEPFGALDIKIRSEMQELLLKIWRELKCTIIFVTHDIQEAIYLPNRIFVFSESQKNGDLNENNSTIETIEIKKPIEKRTPDWKNTGEFESYEKKLKVLQFN